MISAAQLAKTYAGPAGAPIAALGPLDLRVAPGEFACIVGPSGCGKSTLLRLLAGLDAATSGRMQIDTAPAGPGEPEPPAPTLVFQGDSTFPWMTVHENIGYGLRMRGVAARERDETVSRMLRTVGLTQFAEAYPHQLSGGMKQRVALARAWANAAPVLLMDEPFGALDEQTRLVLQQELLRIWDADRKTVLFVTHSIDEALALGDRVLVMSPRPGVIKAEFRVPFDRPRDPVALKRAHGYGDLVVEIWDVLKHGLPAQAGA